MTQKTLTVLENNPDVMNLLASKLGFSPALSFHDVYSLDDPDLLSFIPRPVYALLVIIPLTETWNRERKAEDGPKEDYTGFSDSESVVWFKQTIGHTCGSIALLHCVMNGPASDFIIPGSDLDILRQAAIPLKMADRSRLIENSAAYAEAHQAAAEVGDSKPPNLGATERMGQHFVSFVKDERGRLWELEGSRKGPLDRGILEEDEDVLSAKALDLGIRRIINMEKEAGGRDLRFSCIALAPSLD